MRRKSMWEKKIQTSRRDFDVCSAHVTTHVSAPLTINIIILIIILITTIIITQRCKRRDWHADVTVAVIHTASLVDQGVNPAEI